MKKARAVKAVSLLWLGSLLGAGFAFFTQVLIARSIGPTDLGRLAAALAVAALFVPVVGFGISQYWLNIFGQEGWRAFRWVSGSFSFILGSAVLVFLIFVVMALMYPGAGGYLLLIVLFHVYGQVSMELVSTKAQLEERYSRLALWQLTPHLVRFLIVYLTFSFYINNSGASVAAGIYAVVGIVVSAMAAYEMSKVGRGRMDLQGHGDAPDVRYDSHDQPSALSVAKGTWPFGFASLFQLVYYQSNVVMIEKMLGGHHAGMYNVAFTIMSAVYLFPTVVYQRFLFPKIHRWATQDPEKMFEVFRKGNVLMFLFGSVAMVMVWALAGYFVPLLFGERYAEAVPVLNVLAVSAPFLFVAFSAGAPLATKNNMRIKVFAMGGVAVFNVVANYFLIEGKGVLGAALSTVLSNMVLMVLYYLLAKRLAFKS